MKCIDSKKEQPTKINVANDDKGMSFLALLSNMDQYYLYRYIGIG